MQVIATINGQITSEVAALYALKFAAVHSFSLVLMHFKNDRDDLGRVNATFGKLTQLASEYGVELQVQLRDDSYEVLSDYCNENYVDTIFCATRKNRRYFTNSFSQRLTKLAPNANIAIVRVAHVSAALTIGSILLAIENSRLSVRKFAFTVTLAKGFESTIEVSSIKKISAYREANLTLAHVKRASHEINQELRHYQELSHMADIPFRIRHTFSRELPDTILQKCVQGGHQLLVVGAKRFSFFSRIWGEPLIERIMRETTINMIAFYAKDDLS